MEDINELKQSIFIVDSIFSHQTDKQIYKYITHNIGKWVGEFEYNLVEGE